AGTLATTGTVVRAMETTAGSGSGAGGGLPGSGGLVPGVQPPPTPVDPPDDVTDPPVDDGGSSGGEDGGGDDGNGDDGGGGDDGSTDPEPEPEPEPAVPFPTPGVVEAMWVRVPLEVAEPTANVNDSTLRSRVRYDLYLTMDRADAVRLATVGVRYSSTVWRQLTFGDQSPFRLPGQLTTPFSSQNHSPPTEEELLREFVNVGATLALRQEVSRRLYQSHLHFADAPTGGSQAFGEEGGLAFDWSPVLAGGVVSSPLGTDRAPVTIAGFPSGAFYFKFASLVFDEPPVVDLTAGPAPQKGCGCADRRRGERTVRVCAGWRRGSFGA
ncbi:MAG: hypothetical protein HC927_08830, partial [Deltaproteobacteria bacterium]|nr:hypothetical protein [Deltaproteobacteria bacterium]